MTLSRKIAPAFTITATSLAPLLFSLLLVGCNFQGLENLDALKVLQKEEPRISLEIPSGYTPAQAVRQKTWEEVATAAQKLALDGPAHESDVIASNPEIELKPAVAAKSSLKHGKKKSKRLAKVNRRRAGKKLASSSKKFWKPVRLVSR